jgi:hypothetical protein
MGGLAYHLHDANALVQGLTRKGVRVEFVKEHQLFIGGDSPMANRMLSVMGALACQASLEPSLPFTGQNCCEFRPRLHHPLMGFLDQVPIPRCAPPATSRDTPVM